MAETTSVPWTLRPSWAGILREGRIGAAYSMPGVTITPFENLVLASVIARAGRADDVARALTELTGAATPRKPAIAIGERADLVWAGPDQWLLVSRDRRILDESPSALSELASVSDQSGSRGILRVAGSKIRQTLAKGVLIDLHPRSFRTGNAALTAASHVGVHLWQVDDAPTYDIAVARSIAGSFWRWLSASAEEFGAEVLALRSE